MYKSIELLNFLKKEATPSATYLLEQSLTPKRFGAISKPTLELVEKSFLYVLSEFGGIEWGFRTSSGTSGFIVFIARKYRSLDKTIKEYNKVLSKAIKQIPELEQYHKPINENWFDMCLCDIELAKEVFDANRSLDKEKWPFYEFSYVLYDDILKILKDEFKNGKSSI